jgi:hypothetical protein
VTTWRTDLVRSLSVRVLRAPRITVGCALALAILSVLYTAANLQFKTDRTDVVSAARRERRLAQERIRQFGDRDGFVVAIENRDRAESIAFLKSLAGRIEQESASFEDVFYRIDPKMFAHGALLYVDPDGLKSLREKLLEHRGFIGGLAASPDLPTFFRLVNQRITSGLVGGLFTGFLEQEQAAGSPPLDLGFLAATLRQADAWLDGSRSYTSPWDAFLAGGERGPSPDGYLWTDNQRFLLLLVTPRKDLRDFRQTQASLARLRAAVAAVKAEYPRVAVGVTGRQALEADEMTAALQDTTLATVISLAGLALLLALFLGGARRPILGMGTLAIAVCWTFGAATLLVGHLNILSVVFTPLILGLGIDYGIHVLSRYEEALARRLPVREALAQALQAVGPGIINAAVTAAASFLALALTDFQGLRELGLISGIGILLCLAATLLVLPALVVLVETDRFTAASGVPPPSDGGRRRFFFAYRRPGLVAAAGIGAAVLSLGALGRVPFDLNPLHLQNEGDEAVVWELKLLRGSTRSTAAAEIVARSLDEVRSKTDALKALPTVARVESVLTFLPDGQDQKLQLLRGLRPVVEDLFIGPREGRILDLEALAGSLGRIQIKMVEGGAEPAGADRTAPQRAEIRRLITAFQAGVEARGREAAQTNLAAFEQAFLLDLAEKLSSLRANLRGGPMTPDDLPDPLRKRFIGRNGAFLVRAYPREEIWEPEPLARFVGELRSVDPDVLGHPVDLHNYSQAFRRAYEQAAVYALVAIFLLVLADLRRPTHAVLAMTPLFVGAGWTVGLMWAFGWEFNLANVIFLPLIVGAGVENGIMILHRWREGGAGFTGIPVSTCKGVALASLTTTVGFASLMIARHRGIQSLGLLLTLGTVCVLVASFTVLPGLPGILTGRRRAPAPAPMSWSPSWPRPIGIDGRARRAAEGKVGPRERHRGQTQSSHGRNGR